MQQDTSKIQITTPELDIKASNISENSIQAILDFTTSTQRIQMKNSRVQNSEGVLIGILLSLSLGISVFIISNYSVNTSKPILVIKGNVK